MINCSLKDSTVSEDFIGYSLLLQSLGPKLPKLFLQYEIWLNSGKIKEFLSFSWAGLLANHNLKGFGLVIVLYNSTQSALNLMTDLEIFSILQLF